MQPFICPQCGHQSSFDPAVESACCPKCGYEPTKDPRARARPSQGVAGKRARHKKMPFGTHQAFLDELLSHWDGTHVPDRDFRLSTSERAFHFFRDYQWALGEDPLLRPGSHMRFVRSYQPERRAIFWFVGAYLLLNTSTSGWERLAVVNGQTAKAALGSPLTRRAD